MKTAEGLIWFEIDFEKEDSKKLIEIANSELYDTNLRIRCIGEVLSRNEKRLDNMSTE